MDTKIKRLGKDSLIYGLGGMVSKFIGFLLLPIYTRIFSPSDYGIMDIIATMTALMGIILTAGTETALSYYFYKYSDPIERRRTVTTIALYLLIINVLIVSGVWLAAEKITMLAFGDIVYSAVLRIAILSVPFSSLVDLNLNILRLNRKPWAYIAFSVSQFILTVMLNIYLVAILRVGVVGVFWTNLITAVFYSIIGIVVNRSYFSFRSFTRRRLVEILRYGLPLVIGGISMWIINYMDHYFLLHFSTLDQVGLYSVGLRLASVIGFITWAFRLANAPFQFEISLDKDAPQTYSRTLTYFVLVTSLVCVPLSLFARPALRLLTTEAYVGAYTVVGLSAYSAVAYGLYQIIGVGLLVTKKTLFSGVSIGVGAIAYVLYLYLLVPPLGIVGAALATLLVHATVVALLFFGAQRAYPIPYDMKRVALILISSGVVMVIGTLIHMQNLAFDIIIAIALFISYIGLLLVLPIITHTERKIALDMVRRFTLRFRADG